MKNKIEIIAEIGINHNGNIREALRLIDMAKNAGADTVKFQFYDPKKLLRASDFDHRNWVAVLDSQLNENQITQLKDYTDEIGIKFLCSAFDIERLKFLESIKVERHKIASRSIYEYDYINAVIKTGKPIIASLGLGYINEDVEHFDKTIIRLSKDKGHWASEFNTKFLYCVSYYPAKLRQIKFDYKTFSKTYSGFSDHTIGITSAQTAMVLGAKIIEKHFTSDKDQVGPDHYCSADLADLIDLCKFRDDFQKLDWR